MEGGKKEKKRKREAHSVFSGETQTWRQENTNLGLIVAMLQSHCQIVLLSFQKLSSLCSVVDVEPEAPP